MVTNDLGACEWFVWDLRRSGLIDRGQLDQAVGEFLKRNPRAEAPALDFVFTVCDNAAAEVCPIWPGQPMTAHWGVPDPAAVEGSDEAKRKAFRDALFALRRRIELFANLPFDKLSRLALQERVRDIGGE